MASSPIRQQLTSRALAARISLQPEIADRLESYFRLLARWNKTINLTGFELNSPSSQAIDRLIVEPLLVAPLLPTAENRDLWFDLGSGGGSPAIPLRLIRPQGRLILVESSSRKAAFLREVVRELALDDSAVETVRLEALAHRPGVAGTADLVTVRAVRADEVLLESVSALLSDRGQAGLIGSPGIGHGRVVMTATEAGSLSVVLLGKAQIVVSRGTPKRH